MSIEKLLQDLTAAVQANTAAITAMTAASVSVVSVETALDPEPAATPAPAPAKAAKPTKAKPAAAATPAPAPAPAPAASGAITFDKLREAFIACAGGKGLDVARGILTDFGVEKFSAIKEADYPAAYAALTAA